MRTATVIVCLALGVGAFLAIGATAQPPGRAADGPPRGQGPGGPPGPSGREFPPPPPNPIVEALDTDHDHVISADEMSKAAESLKKLDRNADGKLTREELMPPPPPGRPPFAGPGPGPRGPESRGRDGDRRGPGGPPFQRDRGPDGPPPRGEPRGPGGPPPYERGPGGPPPHPRPELGNVLPPPIKAELRLSDEQQEQLADLEKEVKAKLAKILTEEQQARIEEMFRRGPGPRPGGPPQFGPPGQGPRPHGPPPRGDE